MRSKSRRKLLVLFAVLLVSISCACAVQAASKQAKRRNKWVKTAYNCYYFDRNGKRVRNGIHKIGKRSYYFNSSGAQRTGWRYINGKYYYFRRKNGKNGYLVTNSRVDGIYVDGAGVAQPSSRGLDKLDVMARATLIVDSHTRAVMSMTEKKRKMFLYTVNHYSVGTTPDLTGERDWDLAYADWMMSREYGDCYAFAGVFAYFLKAIGYPDPLMVASGGHAWTELNGRFYDSNWARVIGVDKTFDVPAYLSGTDGRPDWASNRRDIWHTNRSM